MLVREPSSSPDLRACDEPSLKANDEEIAVEEELKVL